MNGRDCYVCGKECGVTEGVLIEGDGGVVNWKGEVLTADFRACRRCEREILKARRELEIIRAFIRAILEQHRNLNAVDHAISTQEWRNTVQLEAIRAFVERVEKRAKAVADLPPDYKNYSDCVQDELAALEAELEPSENKSK